MLRQLVPDALNHLLTQEDWARARLRPFAGGRARIELGPLDLVLRVDGGGLFTADDTPGNADVTIRLPDDAPVRMLTDRTSLFGAAQLTGSADFAETLGFVFRNLRWDAEADLARLTGDIVAHRLVNAATAFVDSRRTAARRLADNLVEFAADEAGQLVRPSASAQLAADIRRLGEDLERLTARVSRLG